MPALMGFCLRRATCGSRASAATGTASLARTAKVVESSLMITTHLALVDRRPTARLRRSASIASKLTIEKLLGFGLGLRLLTALLFRKARAIRCLVLVILDIIGIEHLDRSTGLRRCATRVARLARTRGAVRIQAGRTVAEELLVKIVECRKSAQIEAGRPRRLSARCRARGASRTRTHARIRRERCFAVIVGNRLNDRLDTSRARDFRESSTFAAGETVA